MPHARRWRMVRSRTMIDGVQPTVLYHTLPPRYWIAIGSGRGWIAFSMSGTRMGIMSAEAELWGGTADRVARSDTPGLFTAVSSDIGDNPAGAGAVTVIVEYLDEDGWERFGVATMDGTTPVDVIQHTRTNDPAVPIEPVPGSTQAFGTRINRLYVATLGSASTAYLDANIGVISGFIAGVENAAIPAGDDISACSCVSIPRGRLGVLDSISLAGDIAVGARNRVYVKPFGLPIINFATLNVGTDALPQTLPIPVPLAARSDFVMTAQRSGGGQLEASSTFQVLFLPDPDDKDDFPLLQPPRLT